MRPIDADALLKGKDDHEMISTHLIFNAPTLDVKPVIKGKWLKKYDYFYCSVCDNMADDCDGLEGHATRNYCSYCGADMRESEDKE